jgi:hypothetical protein
MNPDRRGSIVIVGSLVVFIFIGGIFLAYGNITGYRALNVLLGLVSIVTFFGILALPGGWSSERNGFTEGRVRFAITSALENTIKLFQFRPRENNFESLPDVSGGY